MSDNPLRDETELRQSLFDNNNVEEDGGFSTAEPPPRQHQTPPLPPLTTNTTLLEIKAPSALPAGYPLLVQHQGMKLVAIVPAGGVQADQVFRVHATPHRPTVPPVSQQRHRNPPSSISSSSPTSAAGPVGQWKDGFTDIFKYGICHPHAITSLVCSLLAAGQVIQRLKFTWQGVPATNSAESARAFDVIFYITLFHWFMIVTLYLVVSTFDTTTDYSLPPELREPHTGGLLFFIIIFDAFKYAYFVLNLYIIYRLRVSIRHQSAIPGNDFTDACQTIWCPCLAVAQLLRHTTSYDHVPARFCTRTGLLEDDGDDDLI